MWVYQESVPNALTAPSGALPAAQPAAAPRDTAPFRKESASPSGTQSGPGRDGCPGAAKAAARSRTLPRDCAVLAASYLFGTLLAGVVLAVGFAFFDPFAVFVVLVSPKITYLVCALAGIGMES